MKLDWISAGRAWPRARPSLCLKRSQLQSRLSSSESAPRFDFQKIELRWQRRWEQRKGPFAIRKENTGAKAYILPMFPYPSGVLHLGHLRVYTISDVIARFKQMQGRSVIQPMGWDAFGLPAENAAIERGVDPKEWTLQNIAKMKEQLKLMGGWWDWDREFMTCDPQFYKHTQRIFLLLHSQGLAYQKESEVNYDPIDKTVLANEQVDSSGISWRSGAKVEKRLLKQWFIRITEYQDALFEDLEKLAENEKWPERVLAQQQNWLGKSIGAQIPFSLSSDSLELPSSEVEIFTTRLDTLYGAQYIALSLNHPIVVAYARTSQELQDFLDRASSFPGDSKNGFLLPSVAAYNPLRLLEGVRDFVRKPLPVFVAPYVLDDYGSGAVMGVPAHDTRDFDFWTLNRPETPIRSVINSSVNNIEPPSSIEPLVQAGYLSSECVPFAGLSTEAAKSSIMDALSAKTSEAAHETRFKLRDWLISRQRYWGTPIPIVHCDSCGAVPVPAHELPVVLPDLPESYFATSRSNPLASLESWHNTYCPSCRKPAKRDTDTMDTFVDSSWYHLRFANPHNHSLPFSPAAVGTQLPVDLYIGGIEHAILHLLYARFMTKFLSNPSLGLVPPDSALTAANGEPFTRLLSQGMVHGKTYTSPAGKALDPLVDLDLSDPAKPLIKDTQQAPVVTWEKMSKSKHNGVDPTSCIAAYGSDAVRAHMLFLAPVSKVLEWDESRIVGVQRWLGRVWRLVQNHRPAETLSSTEAFPLPKTPESLSSQEQDLLKSLNTTLDSLTHALDETFALNTVVSTLMEFSNDVSTATTGPHDLSEQVARYVLGELVKLMAPITPAFAEECWERLHLPLKPPPGGFTQVESVFDVGWPSPVDAQLLSDGEGRPRRLKCAVQVNGKVKFTCELEAKGVQATEEEDEEEWFKKKIGQCAEGKKWFGEGQRFAMGSVKRVIIVGGGKVVNFVY